MNQEPLDEMVRRAVDRALTSGRSRQSVDDLLPQVLADPDMSLYMRGVEAHDRAEGLEDVYMRDIRARIERYLQERP